jgi:hypothetical protein
MNLSQAMCKASKMRAISTMVHMCGLLGCVWVNADATLLLRL